MVTDGLNNLKLTDEIIIISGMGTKRIKKILTPDITNDLVISSHTKIPDLKKFLKRKHYKISQEKHVSDKKTYTIIYAKKTIWGKWLVQIKKKLKKNV